MLGVCFICNCDDPGQVFTDLKERDEWGIAHLDKLKCIVPVNIYEEDKMNACSQCIGNLNVSLKFLASVFKSQKNVRKKLGVADPTFSKISASILDKLVLHEAKVDVSCSDSEFQGRIFEDIYDSDEYYNEKDLSLTKSEHKNTSQEKQTPPLEMSCSRCNREFESSSLLEDHETQCGISENQPPEINYCKLCQENFTTNSDWQLHKCDLSGIEFREKVKVELSSDDERNDKCRDLEEEGQKRTKKKRGRPVKNLDNLLCEICDVVFTKPWMLKKHMSRVHGHIRRYYCPLCEKAFKQSYHLKEHVTTHTGERKYSCKVCGKSFQRLSSQKRHTRTHDAPVGQKTKRNPFLCTICGRSFPFSNGAQRHMKTHYGVKDHECKICQKRFTQSTHLQVHMRVHTGEKPYICDICGLSYAANGSLQRHRLSHTSSKDDDKVPPRQSMKPVQSVI